MDIINCSEYLKENINKDNISEIEIIEYSKEMCEYYINEIFKEYTDKYNFVDNELTKDFEDRKLKIVEQLVSLSVDYISDNIENDYDYDNDYNTGDIVKDENDEQYTISWFGEDNTFYDNDKETFINLNDVNKI